MRFSKRRMMVLVVIAGMGLAACSSDTQTGEKILPAEVVAVEGSEFSQVILTERAIERLGIQTAQISEAVFERTRSFGGSVEAAPGADGEESDALWVRVPINTVEADEVDMEQPARIVPLSGGGEEGLTARLVEPPEESADDVTMALYYAIGSANHDLSPGQRVRVELTLNGSGEMRLALPYAAVLYGVSGETWAFTNGSPQVYVREPITIDYIEGDTAVLFDGPPVGTEVVIAGAAELFGEEVGVGK